jgi:hypothetical protein
MKNNIGIRECRKCDNNIRCEECVFPEQVKRMQQEIAELRKDKYIAAEEIKAQNELIKQLKAENAELKKHPQCPPCKDFFCYSEELKEHDKAVKAEVVKEFTERFESKLNCIPQHHFTLAQVLFDFDKTKKEMAGDK